MATRDVIGRVVAALNRHDPLALAELYAVDASIRDPQYPQPLRGRSAAQTDFEDFLRSFPDMRVELRSLFVDGDAFAYEFVVTATNLGPIAVPDGELPASGRRLELNLAGVGRVSGGLVAEDRRYFDTAGLLAQLGVPG